MGTWALGNRQADTFESRNIIYVSNQKQTNKKTKKHGRARSSDLSRGPPSFWQVNIRRKKCRSGKSSCHASSTQACSWSLYMTCFFHSSRCLYQQHANYLYSWLEECPPSKRTFDAPHFFRAISAPRPASSNLASGQRSQSSLPATMLRAWRRLRSGHRSDSRPSGRSRSFQRANRDRPESSKSPERCASTHTHTLYRHNGKDADPSQRKTSCSASRTRRVRRAYWAEPGGEKGSLSDKGGASFYHLDFALCPTHARIRHLRWRQHLRNSWTKKLNWGYKNSGLVYIPETYFPEGAKD